MHTAEQFKTYSVAPVVIGWPAVIGIGVKHIIGVPLEMPDRNIWIAAGKYLQDTGPGSNNWWVQVRITFLRSGNPTGHLLFANHSDGLTAAQIATLERPLFKHGTGGPGSVQPPLQHHAVNVPGAYLRSIELPCFYVRVNCDQIAYEIEQGYSTIGGANPDEFITGLRVVSMAP